MFRKALTALCALWLAGPASAAEGLSQRLLLLGAAKIDINFVPGPYGYTPLSPGQHNLAITASTALTVPATAKPHVRPPSGGDGPKTVENADERISFAEAAMGRLRKSSGTPWLGLLIVGVSAFVLTTTDGGALASCCPQPGSLIVTVGLPVKPLVNTMGGFR